MSGVRRRHRPFALCAPAAFVDQDNIAFALSVPAAFIGQDTAFALCVPAAFVGQGTAFALHFHCLCWPRHRLCPACSHCLRGQGPTKTPPLPSRASEKGLARGVTTAVDAGSAGGSQLQSLCMAHSFSPCGDLSERDPPFSSSAIVCKSTSGSAQQILKPSAARA